MEARSLGKPAWRGQFEHVLEVIAEGIIIIDRDDRFVFANATAERILGIKRSDIIGKTFADLKMKVATVDGRPLSDEDLHFAMVIKTGEPIYGHEHMHERLDGTKVIVSASAVPLRDEKGNILAVVNSFTDITERKRAEEELKESERRFREMLEKASLIAIILDTQGKLTFANEFFLNLTGWTEREVIGKNWFAIFIPPEQQEISRRAFLESIATGEIQPHYDSEILTSFDEKRIVSFNNLFLRDPQGNITGMASIGEDITERMRAAEEIRESRRQVLDVLESITDGFVAVDNDWRFTYVNTKAERLLGKRKEALLFRTMWGLFPGLEDTTFGREFKRAVEENTPVIFEEYYPPVDKWFEVHAFPYKTGLSIYFQDISERKSTENELKRKEELSDALNSINATITTTIDFDEAIQKAISDSARTIGAESAAIKLREEDHWIVKYVYELPPDLIGTRLTDEEAKAAAIVFKTKKQFVSNDAYDDERLDPELMRKYSIRSLLVTPLVVKGEVTGVLAFSYRSAPVPFTELEADFANKLAVSVSLALEVYRLYDAE